MASRVVNPGVAADSLEKGSVFFLAAVRTATGGSLTDLFEQATTAARAPHACKQSDPDQPGEGDRGRW